MAILLFGLLSLSTGTAFNSECDVDSTSLLQHSLAVRRSHKPLEVSAAPLAVDSSCDESVPVKGSKIAMPARGFITCCNMDIPAPTMLLALKNYLQAGGRLIDTAPDYGFEGVVGEAVRASGIPREKIWIATKVDSDGWRALLGSSKEWAISKVRSSLQALNLSYVDSIALHTGPAETAFEAPQPVGKNASEKWHTISPADHVEMWQGLMEAKKQGLVRNLAVCETSRREIENLIQKTGETPAIVYVWEHPWLPKVHKDFISWAQTQGMAILAYGMFNWKYIPELYDNITNNVSMLKVATKAANRHNVTWGQLLLKWTLDQGHGFITGLYHPQYLKEDLQCFAPDFKVDDTDHELLALVDNLPCDHQYLAHQLYPGCENNVTIPGFELDSEVARNSATGHQMLAVLSILFFQLSFK